jgi:thiol-disulfide isomerase/thioredoxin
MKDLPLEENEEILNPPPYKYNVSRKAKYLFFIFFIAGLLAYFQMIISRRNIQNKFLIENHLAAVRVDGLTLGALELVEPKSEKSQLFNLPADRWTLVNLWASWCAPCIEEMPSIERLQQKLGDKLFIVAISLDDDIAAFRKFVDMSNPTFSVFIDLQKSSQKMLGVDKFPESFLISPGQKLTFQISGPRDWSSPAVMEFLTNKMSAHNI